MKRRDFLRRAGLAAAGSGVLGLSAPLLTGCRERRPAKTGLNGRMQLQFEPYELQLTHTFAVSSYSRKTTPDVQVRIDYEGYTGFGEASMPPYLGQTVESVCSFLRKVDLGQFRDPFDL